MRMKIWRRQSGNQNGGWRLTAFAACLIFNLVATAAAERLPITTLTVADGLAHNHIHRIYQDPKGFLWLATAEGLARYDGYQFTNYAAADGLGHNYLNDATLDRTGNLWAATNGGGVSRLINESAPTASNQKFVSFSIAFGSKNAPANLVNRILFDRENRLWCATDAGLFRARNTIVADNDFEPVIGGDTPRLTNAAFTDSRGRLWFGIKDRIVRVGEAAEIRIYDPVRQPNQLNLDFDDFNSIVENEHGQILAANAKQIYQFDEAADRWTETSTAANANEIFQVILPARDGGLWIGTSTGLLLDRDNRKRIYSTNNGLPSDDVNTIYYDRDGVLWIGTTGGLSRLEGEAISGYATGQGLPFAETFRISADRAGNIYAHNGCSPGVFAKLEEDQMVVLPKMIMKGRFCKQNQFFQDAKRRWWFLTDRGLEIFAAPPFVSPGKRLTTDDGKSIANYVQAYEDREGKIWLVDLDDNLFVADGASEEIPVFRFLAAKVRAEFILRDSRGAVWLAGRTNLWRYRNNRLEEITGIESLPTIEPRSIFEDAGGRIWIGTRYDGVVFTDEAAADNPRFERLPNENQLASKTIWALTEDQSGGIYFGTGRGVDRLDRATGMIRHFTNDEGIVGTVVNHLFTDGLGNVWVASDGGVSRINPAALQENSRPSPIFINRVLIAGKELPLQETAVESCRSIDLSADQNNIQVSFVGLSYRGKHALRYEYRLEGVDTDWVRAGETREVNYANLSWGKYRFLVRAINSADLPSERAAVFEFQILSPIWLRWWFILIAAGFLAAAAAAVYRYRVSRLLEIERTRTGIASDLHDDIGSNLSKISLLSDIVNLQLAGENPESSRLLISIAEIARESVASMSDIVWAINPNRDSVLALVRRMRNHVEEIFVERGIAVVFNQPADGKHLKLSMTVRRELYLIFKEAVNNVTKHSDCRRITLDFGFTNREIFLRIADDGRGFDVLQKSDGNGLENIKKRAADKNGICTIKSQPGKGTTVEIRFPHR